MGNAYSYLARYGAMKESDYSYSGRDGSCKYSSSKTVTNAKPSGYKSVTRTEAGYMEALKESPIAIAMDADDIFDYGDGVIKACPTTNRSNHGVVLIGYGTSGSDKYWIIKNSWGSRWGEKGYFRILRKQSSSRDLGLCNIYDYAVAP